MYMCIYIYIYMYMTNEIGSPDQRMADLRRPEEHKQVHMTPGSYALAYVHTYVHDLCVCVCTYIYIYIYTHTCGHTQSAET